jgi:hypothetical protein
MNWHDACQPDGKTPEFYARALHIYHEGVKLGCKDCARDFVRQL